jgi:hypothetical protein
MHRVLRDDGIVIVNIGSAFTGPAGKFLQAEYNTFKAVFPDVLLFKVRQDKRDDELQNAILVACKTECPDGDGSFATAALLSHMYRKTDLFTEAPVLTDDLAPVEYYNSLALGVFRP